MNAPASPMLKPNITHRVEMPPLLRWFSRKRASRATMSVWLPRAVGVDNYESSENTENTTMNPTWLMGMTAKTMR